MNDTPTPETDSAYIQCPNEGAWDFRIRQEKTMAKLERERDEWKAKHIQQNKDLGCEMMDPNGTIWDYAKKLQRELAEAREYADKLVAHKDMICLPKDVEVLREANLGLATELHEAREAIKANHKAALVIERMVYEAREQRDRLADALRSIKNELGVPQPEYPAPVANAVKIADEALNQPNL